MKVYTFSAEFDKFRGIYYRNSGHVLELIQRFDGTPMHNISNAEKQFSFVPSRAPKGDTPGLNTHIPVFSRKAVKALADFLEPNGELFPIICEGEKYFVFNVTKVVDALNESDCDLKLFSDGSIMDVIGFSFFQEVLVGLTVFKVPQLVLMDVFVTDPFVERVKAAKLKGFKFRQVWSSH